MNGILLIDKPEGPTSAAVVRRVARLLPSVRVGHLGTLDPFASGVLPLCVGDGTKIARFLNTADKEYEGTICLGRSTDTGDGTGQVTRETDIPDIDDICLRALCGRFARGYEQVPPMYSAIKRDGIPLYKLARRGLEVERQPRRVEITMLQLTREGCDRLRFRVACSKGTYVRVLAEDIGSHVGSAAYLGGLRRTRFGEFAVQDCVPLDEWCPQSRAGFVPIRQALSHMPAVTLSEREVTAVRHGQSRVLSQLVGLPASENALLVDPAGHVVAVLSRRGQHWVFGRVLCQVGDSLQGRGPVLVTESK